MISVPGHTTRLLEYTVHVFVFFFVWRKCTIDAIRPTGSSDDLQYLIYTGIVLIWYGSILTDILLPIKCQSMQRSYSFVCVSFVRFPSKFARRRHMQKGHQGPSSQPVSLACHICSKRFPSNFAKLQHLKKVWVVLSSILFQRVLFIFLYKIKLCQIKVYNDGKKSKIELNDFGRTLHGNRLIENIVYIFC